MAGNPKGKLSELRRYIRNPEDIDIIKEMLADGLSVDLIKEALGYGGNEPQRDIQPDSHGFGNIPVSSNDGSPQPGAPGDDSEEEENTPEDDNEPTGNVAAVGTKVRSAKVKGATGNAIMQHISGLLHHLSKS